MLMSIRTAQSRRTARSAPVKWIVRECRVAAMRSAPPPFLWCGDCALAVPASPRHEARECQENAGKREEKRKARHRFSGALTGSKSPFSTFAGRYYPEWIGPNARKNLIASLRAWVPCRIAVPLPACRDLGFSCPTSELDNDFLTAPIPPLMHHLIALCRCFFFHRRCGSTKTRWQGLSGLYDFSEYGSCK